MTRSTHTIPQRPKNRAKARRHAFTKRQRFMKESSTLSRQLNHLGSLLESASPVQFDIALKSFVDESQLAMTHPRLGIKIKRSMRHTKAEGKQKRARRMEALNVADGISDITDYKSMGDKMDMEL